MKWLLKSLKSSCLLDMKLLSLTNISSSSSTFFFFAPQCDHRLLHRKVVGLNLFNKFKILLLHG